MQTNPDHTNRSKQGQRAIEILGSNNLYGYSRGDIPKPGKADVLVPNYIPRAIYPIISELAFARTMSNFRAYIDEYNHATGWENVDIENHNAEVFYYLRDKATDMQRAYAKTFPQLNEKLTKNREYNAEADKINAEHGPIIKKRTIDTVKYPTEQFFQNMLHVYNVQLAKQNEIYIKYYATTPLPLIPFTINSYFVSQLERENGVKSLNVCHKTVRNHRMRLEEAGVLIDYVFHGRQRGVQLHFNPQILVYFDAHPNRLTGTDNQSFSLWKGKNVLDNNEITGTFKDEYKDKNDAAQSFGDKEQAEPAGSLHYKSIFYRNTRSKEGNSPVAAAPETVKIVKTKSEMLRDLLLHPQELAEKLANKLYTNYKPIDVRLLAYESMSGKLTDAEFRELIIQDFFKSSAKLWTETTPYVGSWKKAINQWMQHKFLNYRGYALGKERVIDEVEQLRYRLEGARRWFLANEHRPPYPGDYFDIKRLTKQEVGFEYTKKAWNKHQQYLNSKKANDLKEERKAMQRLKRNADSTKYKREILRFLKERITLTQLHNYVANNLPPDYLRDLPMTIQKMMAEPAPIKRTRKSKPL